MNTLDTSLGFLVSRLASALRADLEAALAPHELTAPQWAVLMRLREREGWPQKELGDSLGVNKATIGGVVLRLEKKGLIRRRRDEADARYFQVMLTPAGRLLAEATAPLGAQVNRAALAGFSEAEAELFQSMLLRARRALRD
jgi:DNA-binding MarR family transcriptional regulator